MFTKEKYKVFNKPLLWRGWGGLLLFIFLFPQMNNALHYFVVEHHFHQYNPNEKQFHHNDKTHDCEQSIFKIPSTLLFDFGYTEFVRNVVFYEVEKPLFILFYTKIFFENVSDRGPPIKAITMTILITIHYKI